MKKIVLWFMSTLTAVTLLFGYHTSTSSSTDSSAAATAGGNASAEAPVGATGTSTGTPTGTPTGTGTSSGATTVTGSVAQTRWGPVQVRLTVSVGKITAVQVVQYPNSNGKDQQINAQALPILVKETLTAQSSTIDMVSGATYTSDGYLTSLQSALDQAGL